MKSTWEPRDLPVLQALVAYFDELDAYRIDVPKLMELTGLSHDEVARALRNHMQAGLISGVMASQVTYPPIVTGVSEKARRLAGGRPNPENLADRLLGRRLSHSSGQPSLLP